MKRNLTFAGAVGLTLVAVALNAEPPQAATLAPRPLTATPAAVQPPMNSVVLFKNSGCRSDVGVIDIAGHESGSFHELPDDAKDEISSMRWNLTPGVVVVLYQNGASTKKKGIQYAIFGNGVDHSLDHSELNDELSSWAWYRIY